MKTYISTHLGVLRVAAPVVAVALLASACASSGGSGSGSSATSNAAGGGGGGGGGGKPASAVTVESHSGPMGTFLTDGSGKSLYMFASDSATKSTCSGTCLVYWPPLDASSAVHTSGGVSSGKITTITRSDGTKQVVYAGHPLYYYKGDSKAGDTNGQGSTTFGAKWWLLTPSGQPITSSGAAASSQSTSKSSSSKGGSWG
jgi:predicted lipoprotein with Yx(FWY)xxD motif